MFKQIKWLVSLGAIVLLNCGPALSCDYDCGYGDNWGIGGYAEEYSITTIDLYTFVSPNYGNDIGCSIGQCGENGCQPYPAPTFASDTPWFDPYSLPTPQQPPMFPLQSPMPPSPVAPPSPIAGGCDGITIPCPTGPPPPNFPIYPPAPSFPPVGNPPVYPTPSFPPVTYQPPVIVQPPVITKTPVYNPPVYVPTKPNVPTYPGPNPGSTHYPTSQPRIQGNIPRG